MDKRLNLLTREKLSLLVNVMGQLLGREYCNVLKVFAGSMSEKAENFFGGHLFIAPVMSEARDVSILYGLIEYDEEGKAISF